MLLTLLLFRFAAPDAAHPETETSTGGNSGFKHEYVKNYAYELDFYLS